MEFLSQDLYNYDFFNPEVLNPNLSPYFNPMGMFGSLGLASGNIPEFVTTDALDVSDPLVRNIAGGTADPSVYNSMLDSAAIMADVEQNLAAQRDNFEVPVEDVIGPTEELGVEDSIFQILYDTIIGEQGIPEGVSAEVIEAIRGDFGPTTAPEQLREIAEQIAEAGGFDEWLAQQETEEAAEVTTEEAAEVTTEEATEEASEAASEAAIEAEAREAAEAAAREAAEAASEAATETATEDTVETAPVSENVREAQQRAEEARQRAEEARQRAEEAQQRAEEARQRAEEAEVVDIAQEDTVEAADSEFADTTTTEDAETVPDYGELVNPDFEEGIAPGVSSAPIPPSTPTTPTTPPPGSAGVIIDIEDLMNAGDWTVFLPGVIPGLPSSPTIIGTVEEILSNPSGIFDDLLEDLEGIVTNPEQVLEDILNDAADSDGLITIGGIQSVISDVMDRIQEGPEAPPATIATEQDPTIIGGEDRDEEEVSESISQEPPAEEEPDVTPEPIEATEPPAVESVEPTTEPPAVEPVETTTELPTVEPVETTTELPTVTPVETTTELPTVEPVETTTEPPTVTPVETTTEPPADSPEPQPEVGTVTTTTLPPDSPEPQPEVGFDDTEDAVSAGGGGGGMFDEFKSNLTTPGITYQPVALQALVSPEYQRMLDEVIQRNSGMLTQPEGFLLS